MAQSDNRKQFLVESIGCAIWVNKKLFKIFAFFLLVAFSDFYEPTVSEARRVGAPRWSKRGRRPS